jgi:MYXO-CTERM domain-containing protein
VPGVEVWWTLPSITGSVAWEVWAETSDPRDAALPPTSTPAQLIEREPVVNTLKGHLAEDLVAFANDASEACAVVVVKDLRTGQELRSLPQCAEPGAATATFVDHGLGSCDEPPTPESTKLWCASLSDLARADEDDPGNNHCQGIGPGGMAGAGAAGTGADSEEQDAAAEPRKSSSCHYSPATGSVWFGATAIGLGLLASARRRRGQDERGDTSPKRR